MMTLPLVVDLDGTLVKTDLLIEALCLLLKQNLLYIFVLPLWLLKGKAVLKQHIAQRVSLDVSVLPYHAEFLDYLKMQREQGRRLIMATANDEQFARQVADHLQLFEVVLGSDGVTNLAATCKRDRLVAMFGDKGFDYAGNERRDLAVWSAARQAIVVNPTRHVRAAVPRLAEVERLFEERKKRLPLYLRELRLHQWVKNLLVFVPLFIAHRVQDLPLLTQTALAFVAFGLCASSVYLLNDLLDLPADRHHPHKRQRPFAAGDLPLRAGLVCIPLLLVLSCLVSALLPLAFLGILALYYSTTLAYSLLLKRLAPLDVFILAGLYTVRLLAGAAVTSLWLSSWLLAFTTFLFLSLALVKRYAELVVVIRTVGEKSARARGYQADDRELLAAMGIASGYLAVVVLALYITSVAAPHFFSRYELIWLLCPLLLYWISYMWLCAHRGGMYDDPVVFALKNRSSIIAIACMVAVFIVAA